MHYHLDAESNQIGLIDPNGARDRMEYDPVDRLARSIHRLEGVTEFAYDELDRLVRVQASNGVLTEYAYDLLGRRIEEKSADRGTLKYAYDLADNIALITEGRGITMRYTYDMLERITEIGYPNTHPGKDETVRHTWDTCTLGKNRLCTVQDESGTTSYRYDVWGNVIERRHTEIGVVYTSIYAYDDGDRVIRQTFPSGRIVEYSRDTLRRISGIRARVNNRMQPIVIDLGYRADDLMEFCRYGNGLEDRRSYDLQGRLLQQTLSTAGGLSVYERAYEYDANSNIVRLSVDGLAKPHGYDALDRITRDGGVNPAEAYQYDLNGNRLRQDLEDNSVQAEYFYREGSNQLEFTDRILRKDQSVAPSSRGLRLEYSDAGRLWKLHENGELRAEYIYNAEGQRTRKVVHIGETRTVTVYHYGMGGELLTETDSSGQLVRDYVWAGGQVVAQIGREVQEERLLYLYSDHLMTTRVATDQAGTIVWRWESEVFGGSVADTDPDRDGSDVEMPLRFPGQYRDVESGMHYNWNRYYDPKVGQYITSDPIGLSGGISLYLYSNANPLRFYDWNGNHPLLVVAAAQATVRAVASAIIRSNLVAKATRAAGKYGFLKVAEAMSDVADRRKYCHKVHMLLKQTKRCKTDRECKEGQDCETIRRNIKRIESCLLARQLVLICHNEQRKGVKKAHDGAIDQEIKILVKCQDLARNGGCCED